MKAWPWSQPFCVRDFMKTGPWSQPFCVRDFMKTGPWSQPFCVRDFMKTWPWLQPFCVCDFMKTWPWSQPFCVCDMKTWPWSQPFCVCDIMNKAGVCGESVYSVTCQPPPPLYFTLVIQKPANENICTVSAFLNQLPSKPKFPISLTTLPRVILSIIM